MGNVLSEFIQILVSGVVSLGEGIAEGVTAMAKALFLTSTTTEGVTTYGLSVFGGIVAIFAGLSLAISLTTRIFRWVVSLGN